MSTPSELPSDGSRHNLKRVLYFGPNAESLTDLLRVFESVPGCETSERGGTPYVRYRNVSFAFVPIHERGQVMARLHTGYCNLVLLDVRKLGASRPAHEAFVREVDKLIVAMETESDVEMRFGFHRVLALVGCDSDTESDDRIAALARQQVARIFRDRRSVAEPATQETAARTFAESLISDMVERTAARRAGKKALCAAGGGLTGLFFEIGVLKCLDDCLGPGGANLFDGYYGISAGAVLSGLLANGYSPDELMASVADLPAGRLGRIDFNLARGTHLNVAEMKERFLDMAREALHLARDAYRGTRTFSVQEFVTHGGSLVVAPFRGDAFRMELERCFSRAGTTNDFRKLSRKLYVGATDQDARTHVVFGTPGYDDVPISRAIQASYSINPAFTATPINGRYYEDGAVTRTSNFGEAIEHGADMLFIVDPFVPYVSKDPGYARRRGALYNIDQDIRTLSYTRFERARAESLRKHPWISSYTFLPANSLRKLMSVNPMDHRPFLPIWRGAYLSTLNRIHALGYRMRGELAGHGITLNTERAEAVAERLRRTKDPKLADFFPDGVVRIRTPPLTLERQRASIPPASAPSSSRIVAA